MSETRARCGRPGLACDGRQHPDGEHECAARFWQRGTARMPGPDGSSGDIRVRAMRRGWWRGRHERTGELVDLCPYHAPASEKR
jgi:hypothetical protein